MALNKYLDIAPEVQKALDEGRPVVALESTIISHGMPYPQNVETALNVEKIIREHGATPATIAVIGGRLKAGLSPEEIDYLGKTGPAVAKASRRDLPVLVAEGRDGATTVTTTMIIAHMAGISVFAAGGIGDGRQAAAAFALCAGALILWAVGRASVPVIIAMLIVYCLKEISFAAPAGWVPALAASGAAVALHLWKGNDLLSIFGATALYMLLVQGVFA